MSRSCFVAVLLVSTIAFAQDAAPAPATPPLAPAGATTAIPEGYVFANKMEINGIIGRFDKPCTLTPEQLEKTKLVMYQLDQELKAWDTTNGAKQEEARQEKFKAYAAKNLDVAKPYEAELKRLKLDRQKLVDKRVMEVEKTILTPEQVPQWHAFQLYWYAAAPLNAVGVTREQGDKIHEKCKEIVKQIPGANKGSVQKLREAEIRKVIHTPDLIMTADQIKKLGEHEKKMDAMEVNPFD